MSGDASRTPRERYVVLEVFGLKLEVSNPRLAELLTMDAAEALTTDVRELMRWDRRLLQEAVPGTVLAPPSPRSEQDERVRREFRERADVLGGQLGFTVSGDGAWKSPTGAHVLTRTFERPVTVAAAVHYVVELAGVSGEGLEQRPVVLIAADQPSVDVFKVAITQRKVHHAMRTVSIGALEELAALHDEGAVTHREASVLLAPGLAVDVGEMVSVLKADVRDEDRSRSGR